MTDVGGIAAEQVRSYVDRVLRLREEIKELNADVSEVYKEAVGNGFDKKTLQATVKRAAQEPEAVQEQDALLELYWRAYTGTAIATRAGARDVSKAQTMARAQALARAFAETGSATLTLTHDPNDHSEDGLEHFDATPHDTDGVVIETAEETEPASTDAAGLSNSPAPAMGDEPSSPSMAPHTCGAGEGDRPMRAALPNPIPVQSHAVREAPAPLEMPPIPDCLRRTRATG